MIKVPSPINEPPTFNARCRQPGMQWLAANPAPAEVTYNLWSPFRDDLAVGFAHRCGYQAMLDLEGTVDHFFSRSTHRHLAYEWTNYRFISQTKNSSKRILNDALLDPFEVEDDWFYITLPDLQLRLTDAVPDVIRPKAEFTLKRLKLVQGTHVLRLRRYWYNQHALHGLSLAYLLQFAPMVARAIQRWINLHGTPLPHLPATA